MRKPFGLGAVALFASTLIILSSSGVGFAEEATEEPSAEAATESSPEPSTAATEPAPSPVTEPAELSPESATGATEADGAEAEEEFSLKGWCKERNEHHRPIAYCYEGDTGAFGIDIGLHYRLRGIGLTEIPLGDGETLAASNSLENRLTISPDIDFYLSGSHKLHAVVELVNGPIAGDIDEPELLDLDKRERYELRYPMANETRIWADFDLKIGRLQLGRMPMNWGLGIVGNEALEADDPFGDNYLGDISDGVGFGTRPIDLFSGGKIETRLTLAAAYIWRVIRDSAAEYEDNASQMILALQWMPKSKKIGAIHENLGAGAYVVRRQQRHDTDLMIYDIYARTSFGNDDIGGQARLEGAWITGHTRAAAGPSNPGRATISQQGAVIGGGVRLWYVTVDLEAGYASGDANPYDEAVTNFKFHSDYNVGLILWDEYIAALSAAGARRLDDPSLSGSAPNGYDQLPTSGSVTNAKYLFPTVTLEFLDDLIIRAGALFAWTDKQLVDPYQASFYHGGSAVNYFGESSGDFLGTEVDLRVSYKTKRYYGWLPHIGLMVEGGVFMPGDAFENAANSDATEEYIARVGLDIEF